MPLPFIMRIFTGLITILTCTFIMSCDEAAVNNDLSEAYSTSLDNKKPEEEETDFQEIDNEKQDESSQTLGGPETEGIDQVITHIEDFEFTNGSPWLIMYVVVYSYPDGSYKVRVIVQCESCWNHNTNSPNNSTLIDRWGNIFDDLPTTGERNAERDRLLDLDNDGIPDYIDALEGMGYEQRELENPE